MNNIFRLFSVFSLCIVLTACNTVNSEDLKTSGISADIIIDGASNQTNATAFLTTGSGLGADPVNISAGDTLSASDGTNSQVMSKASNGKYITSFSGNVSKTYTVSLTRDAGVDAPNTVVTIPAPFTINSPTANQTFVSNSPIPLTWSPANGSGTLKTNHSVDCIDNTGGSLSLHSANYTINNTGSTTITLGMPTPVPGKTLSSCSAIITLKLSTSGTIDPAYGSGSVEGSQTRSVSISVTP